MGVKETGLRKVQEGQWTAGVHRHSLNTTYPEHAQPAPQELWPFALDFRGPTHEGALERLALETADMRIRLEASVLRQQVTNLDGCETRSASLQHAEMLFGASMDAGAQKITEDCAAIRAAGAETFASTLLKVTREVERESAQDATKKAELEKTMEAAQQAAPRDLLSKAIAQVATQRESATSARDKWVDYPKIVTAGFGPDGADIDEDCLREKPLERVPREAVGRKGVQPADAKRKSHPTSRKKRKKPTTHERSERGERDERSEVSRARSGSRGLSRWPPQDQARPQSRPRPGSIKGPRGGQGKGDVHGKGKATKGERGGEQNANGKSKGKNKQANGRASRKPSTERSASNSRRRS